MYYVGLDIHTKSIFGTIINRRGSIVNQQKFGLTIKELDEFLIGIPKNKLKVVIEACGIWEQLYDWLEQRCKEVCVANPYKTKAIASAKIKTDKLDSAILANLLRAGYIAKCYIPNKQIRELRQSVRQRQGLVKVRTGLKNRIYAILRKHNIKKPNTFNDIFTARGKQWLKQLNNEQINCYLRVLDIVETEIKEIWHKSKNISLSKQINLLKTMPGIGNIAAIIIAAEIADINRFESPRKLCNYAGLVPKLNQSGDKHYQSGITKEGSKLLRWILIQCANIAIKTPGKFQLQFYKLCKKKHRNVAITAIARKMLYVMWFMLTNNEPYLS
jgi:transposase